MTLQSVSSTHKVSTPALSNIDPRESLAGLARSRSRDYITKTIRPALVEESLQQGWSIDKKNKISVRMKKKKAHGVELEDRVWTLLYKLGFLYLHGTQKALLKVSRESDSPSTQIDVVGIDEEVAIAVECKSSEKPKKRPEFQEELGKHALVRQRFANAINEQFKDRDIKKQVGLVMFINHIDLTDNDRKRAQAEKVVVFDEQDLSYYEKLAAHLGPAAKYQFLADIFADRAIPGLTVKTAAIKARMGGLTCYTFSISPKYLLKIAYISHRAKGKASDVNTYQRMISKVRLNAIKEYINDGGLFPTNIVINLSKRPNFQKTEQDAASDSSVMGWLELRPAYKSAWVIDGQHRLFAFSGLEGAEKASLSVLAFEELPASKQAELFIDINAEQRRVKQSLLQELYAELHWNADEPEIRVRAIVSKAVQSLDADRTSPFFHRIVMSDETKDNTHCIPIRGLTTALLKPGFYISMIKKGEVVSFGPLWAGNNDATLRRTTYIINNWFDVLRTPVADWWDAGAGEGGGLAMNDAVTAGLNVLRSACIHLESTGVKLVELDDDDLFQVLRPFATVVGEYLGSLTEEERRRFRDLRGGQGQTTRTRRLEKAIHDRFPAFDPPELGDFMLREKAQTNKKAKEIVDRIEIALQETVIQELKREYGTDESQWWMMGVPKGIRQRVTNMYEMDDGKRGGKEYYFDLSDYRNIVHQNWGIFEPLVVTGKQGVAKEKRTAWMNDVNEIRRVVAHPSSGVTVSIEQLEQIEEYDSWLRDKLSLQVD